MPYEQTRWKLDALMPGGDQAALDQALAVHEKSVKKVERWRGRLKPALTAKDFQALLDDFEVMVRAGTRLGAFAALRFYADTQDPAALAYFSQMQDRLAQVQNRTLFFSLWWKALDDKRAAKLMAGAGNRRYWLEAMRHFKPHTLSEAEEKVINLKDVSGFSALDNVYDMLTSAFKFTLEVDGQKQTLTRDALMVYARHPNADLRRAAYQELYRVYAEQAPVLAQIYRSMMTDWRNENVGLRQFKTPIAVRNLANDLPDKVVATLLKVIRQNAGVFQRYFELKAKWLGQPRLRRYDLYAPLAPADRKIAYPDGVQMVLETFGEFSPAVADAARQVFDAGHVDAEVRPGKRGGAFCLAALPELPPWVLLNYTGRARDVAVIAHELGHAIHYVLAGGNSALTYHASLPMAETASVFAEMLLNEKLLATEPDPAVRRDILAASIDDAYATVGRQGYFALWEQEAHELVRQGKTADEMAARYLELLRAQFGSAVEVSEEFQWEWVSIPHFYGTPFYVYAYSFGQLLVLALYQMYKREGEAFKAKYLKILTYGGSEAPARILKEAGINIASEAFWQGGYDVIKGMIAELEKLSP
ncbi:MAG: M3 family oligoendopeptidase [Anaerolineales bacterium]|nr:M3 family oligoendopeptidase [Anaerolineales bacterium]